MEHNYRDNRDNVLHYRDMGILIIAQPYHISNVHEWNSDPKALFPKCVHETLSSEEERSKKWLRSGSVAHNALRKVALQDTLLRDMKKLTGFHHTGSLEVFYSLIFSIKILS